MTRRRLFSLPRRGAAAVLAMLFMVLMATLTLAMFSLATTNVQSSYNLSDVNRAQAAAEAGLRWIQYRFVHMNRPKTTIGNITPTVAASLWPSIKTAIQTDMSSLTLTTERPVTTTTTSITTSSISTETNGATFVVSVVQSSTDARNLIVTSTGKYNNAVRAISMTFDINKKMKFAIVGRVPIQLGRNTIVEGPVAMVTDSMSKGPPILMLSDFDHFDSSLTTKVDNFETWMASHHNGYDNRISVNNPTEYAAATAAGYTDVNGDAYIDEYDLFLKQYDTDHTLSISKSEFTNPSTGTLYDQNLFSAIDSINGPMYSGDPARVGYGDGTIDNNDGYAKVRGQIMLAVTTDEFNAAITSSSRNTTTFPWTNIHNYMEGPVTPDNPEDPPVIFGAPAADMVDLNPANFQQAAANYGTQSGTFAGASSKTATTITNKVLAAADANGGTVIEESPKGSTSFQAVYKRPVFKNMTLKNVTIPQGMNALFQNCTFQGVTFVTTQSNIVNSAGQTTTDDANAGMTWARAKSQASFNTTVSTAGSFTTNSSGKITKYQISGMSSAANISTWDSSGNPILPTAAGSFAYGGSQTSLGATQGNNLRFDGCTFNGPVAGNYATDYTHFANSWEFTGATMFNNQVDQTATIVSPQVNIEMGSFTDPSQAPSTMVGVVVVGNIDIRGSSTVDGSIIITGNGAGNTTLAYFGADDAATEVTADPIGGYGKLNIRYNPDRALPDGINIAIDILPDVSTYSEGVK